MRPNGATVASAALGRFDGMKKIVECDPMVYVRCPTKELCAETFAESRGMPFDRCKGCMWVSLRQLIETFNELTKMMQEEK